MTAVSADAEFDLPRKSKSVPHACSLVLQIKCVDGPVLGPRDVPIPLEELYYFPKFADVPVS